MRKNSGGFLFDFVRSSDLVLLALCTASTLFGIVLIASATHFRGTLRYVIVQGAGLLLGIVLYFFLSSLDITELREGWKWLFGFNIFFLLLLLTPLGIERNGNRAWLGASWFPVNIQPAEVVKISFIILLAYQISLLRENYDLRRLGNVMQPLGHTLFMVGLIVVISGDAGSALVYLFIFVCMAFAAGLALRWMALGIGGAAAGAVAVWKLDLLPTYMRERFMVIFDHSYDVLGKGWQQTRSMLALGSGQLTGQGLFNGAQTQSSHAYNLPERQTDFIFSVCGEELGFFGCLAVIVLLFAIILHCLLVARDAATPMESYICVGVASMLIFQCLANIGMCLFLVPVIGLTLPFFSYGGSSIVTLYAAVGIVSGIKKRSRPEWLMN